MRHRIPASDHSALSTPRSALARKGLSLLEVLIAIFVMGIGVLAILTLFPLGALSMAQALQHDRAAAAAGLAAEYADVLDLRHDPAVAAAMTTAPPGHTGPPHNPQGPSWPVFVDGFGAVVKPGPIGARPPATPGIARVRPSHASTLPLIARWFSLPDDVSFGPDATPARGQVERGGRYTWAYLLRRPRASTPSVVSLDVVIYSGRDTHLGTGESVYSASGTRGDPNLTLTYTRGQGKPALRRNAWILDMTLDTTNHVTQGQFYRVVNVAEATGTTLALELESPLLADVNTIVVLDNVIEVVRMGTGRLP